MHHIGHIAPKPRPKRLTRTSCNQMRQSANAVLESKPLYPDFIFEQPLKTPRPPNLPTPRINLHVKNIELHLNDSSFHCERRRYSDSETSHSKSSNIHDKDHVSGKENVSNGFAPYKKVRSVDVKNQKDTSKQFLQKAKKTVKNLRHSQFNPLFHLPERPKSVNLTIPKSYVLTLENRELLFDY
ncbi:hypothetical protein TRFO_01346 [Tritrichomonas foetus]|uniref:Uncharacterized protein n=1 Tax=Tritrichomonas foetus TaxID=1144522 RepID=A0A1J4K748_9EUKA|nr:hypothetical protein TRFO_01346 [Tritrichomonas foetus]|eukprot:OHT07199.1 hypothetical protein TRFO_01346 [Tritrichomonas foetus]